MANKKLKGGEEEQFELQIGLGLSNMTDEEKFLFDVHGYLQFDDLIPPDTINHVNAALAQLEAGRHGPSGANLSFQSPNRYDLQVMNPVDAGAPFEALVAIPQVIDRLNALIWGRQYRLVYNYALTRKRGGATPLNQGGSRDPRRHTRYRCTNGEFRCLLITCLMALTDVPSGDGCFCVIPGSHKSNFPLPYEPLAFESVPDLLEIPLKAGTVLLYSENLTHGDLQSRLGVQRRLYFGYGPSYMLSWPECEPSGPALDRAKANEEHRRLLMPPYYHPLQSQRKRT
ncbi:MAG: phytanoyl-CoA dioxygenase family protein [Deinococcus sp.]|nr:phytanoyl-CoA dioxygenase family protein [Deinococcus sp.]